MYQSFKYRLYPFRSQEMELLRQLDELKFLHNYALEQRIDAWRTEKRSVGYTEQAASLTQWRNYDRNGIGRVHSQVAQECLQRIADSYKHFFRRLKEGKKPGFPHFKRAVTSLTYPQAYSAVTITEGRMGTKRLHLSKIGDVPIELHRQPVDGRIKTCTVKREGDRWYAVLTVEMPDAAPPPATPAVSQSGGCGPRTQSHCNTLDRRNCRSTQIPSQGREATQASGSRSVTEDQTLAQQREGKDTTGKILRQDT